MIDGHHELYTLSIAMMLGLRYSIFLTNNQLVKDRKNDRMWLDSDEFMKVEKYIFRPDGSNNTPPHQLSHTFKFKDYSPLPFAFIRRMFGINEYEFHHSVCGNANFIEFISNAKSGQFFFYSSDGKYMIKTMTNQESKFLRRILPHYFRHCSQNPNTILTKFLGMYRVKLYHLRKNVKFVIMNSVFDTDKTLSSFYDLKGSVVGRSAKRGESVLKDNDLRKESGTIRLQSEARERLRDQVRRDCEFLKEMKIMDYSMLVGIHYLPSKASKRKNDIGGLNFRGSLRSLRRPKSLERSRSDSDAVPGDNLLSKQSSLFPSRPSTGTYRHTRSRSTGIGSTASSFPFQHHDIDSHASVSASESQLETPHAQSLTEPAQFFTQMEKEMEEDKVCCPYPNLKLPLPPVPSILQKANKSPNSAIDETQLPSIASTSPNPYEDEEEQSLLGKVDNSNFAFEFKSPSSAETTDDDYAKERKAIEKRKELAVEQNYWPFHRHYELNGDRRIIPMKTESVRFVQEDANDNIADALCTAGCFGDPDDNEPDLNTLREKLTLDEFTPPISSRRDGGLVMETNGVLLPLKVKAGGQSLKCDGKIYYMGIIDILQQFNTRKRLEARYRKITGGEKLASCVHPQVYADRFVNFFEEYTVGKRHDKEIKHDGGMEEVVFAKDNGRKKEKTKNKNAQH